MSINNTIIERAVIGAKAIINSRHGETLTGIVERPCDLDETGYKRNTIGIVIDGAVCAMHPERPDTYSKVVPVEDVIEVVADLRNLGVDARWKGAGIADYECTACGGMVTTDGEYAEDKPKRKYCPYCAATCG